MQTETCTAFHGQRLIATGTPVDVALAIKTRLAELPAADILIFDDASGRQIDFDLSGSDEDVAARLRSATQEPPRTPGRPKLGVVAREVTLLPRHWEWLAKQPGGASPTLRKLVDAARNGPRERARQAQAATDRFMMAMLGDRPGYEEAARALYAGDRAQFQRFITPWPADLKAHAEKLASPAFAAAADER